MKALPFKIPRTEREAYLTQVDKQPYLYDALHQHPEIQITWMVKGTGRVLLGNYIGEFKPDELFIIGSNIPHVFKNDDEYYQELNHLEAHAITVFVDFQQFKQHFLTTSNMIDVHDFLLSTKHCLKLKTIKNTPLVKWMTDIDELKGLSKTIRVLEVVEWLSNQTTYETLISETIDYNVQEVDGKRLNEVIQFVMKEYQRPIQLTEVANIANMTTPSFCRFFKQRTRKSFIVFLNELRVNQACKLLLEKDVSVLEVALMAGFNNLSHFNRKFKAIAGVTPTDFRNRHKVL